jgi:hypothetical protein
VGTEMSYAAPLYLACSDLFSNFPLAATDADPVGAVRSMVLMLRDIDEASFFVLTQRCSGATAGYSLSSWPAGDAWDIEAEGPARVPDALAKAITDGVPLPRHGSMFGWADHASFGALIVIYTEHAPERPLPRWAVLPRCDIPETRWPPFTGRRFFGQWFWDDYHAGRVSPLDGLIRAAPNTVYWVDTQARLGADSCAVVCDVKGRDGRVLRRGAYLYSEALRRGGPLPSLQELLADSRKTDLAPRFRRRPPPQFVMAHGEGRAEV